MKASFALVLAMTALAPAAHAATTMVTVDSHSGPWEQSLNPTLAYGVGDNTAPTSVSAGFDFTAGGSFTIEYISGLTNPYVGAPSYDAIGDQDYVTTGGTGSSGTGFPSAYVSQDPTYLNELIGAFANASGVVVGTPFAIGDGLTVTAPTGATQLLLGVNDDIFYDNSGSLLEQVTGPTGATAVPEPVTWSMMLAGFGLIGFGLRRRARTTVAYS